MRKRSVAIKGHQTSIALEKEFWDVLEDIARAEYRSMASLIADIDRRRLAETPAPGLASALRVFVLKRCLEAGRPASPIRDKT